MHLNPTLFEILTSRFRRVNVQNGGQALAFRHLPDLATGGWQLSIHGHGESYYVDCPFCTDTRQRLSINHRYGVYDEVTRSDNLHLVKCFNEDCLKRPGRIKELADKVFGLRNVLQRRQMMRLRPGGMTVVSPPALQQSRPPGDCVALRDLTPDHPARTYLGERAFDVEDLSRDWHLSYCVRADEDYRLAQDRLIIPVIMNGVWVGWQARHVGERPWKAERVPKYFTAPGTPRGRVLYNHDLALKRPLVVVCEGPTDVWRVGPAAVALLGKQATPTQLNLVVSGWRDRPVVVLLDGDARADSARLCNQLRPYFKGRLVEVSLPPGQDPGNLSRGELWTLIGAEARHHRVDVVGAAAADSDVPEGCFQAAVGP